MAKNSNLNYEDVRGRLQDWLINFVEVEHPSLGNWAPCPYARQARLNNKIHIVIDNPTRIADYEHLLSDFDVVALCFDPEQYSADQITRFTRHINTIFEDRDVVVLEDHPAIPEYVNGVQMNFGYCGLLLMQRASKLSTASEQLRRAGYYDVWSEQELDEVVNWR
jgi:hypothetical protein